MAVLAAEAEERFVARVIHHLGKHHAEILRELSEEKLQRRVRGAIKRARSHGFTWESAITGFSTLMFAVAPNFDRHPAIESALEKQRSDENSRITALFQEVPAETWDEIAKFADQSVWSDFDRNPAP